MLVLRASTEDGAFFIFHPDREMESILDSDDDEELHFSDEVSSDGGRSIDLEKIAPLEFEILDLGDLFERGFDLVLSEDDAEMGMGITLLEAGVSTYRDVPKPWLGLGFGYKMMGDYERAVECLETIFEIPDDAFGDETNRKFVLMALHRDLVFCYAKQGDHVKAFEYAQKGYEVAPDDLGTVINLASSCLMAGRLKSAKGYFEEAERMDPEDRQVQEALLEIEIKMLEEKE